MTIAKGTLDIDYHKQLSECMETGIRLLPLREAQTIGQAIWKSIEATHPEIEVWETCTPYFDRRNIHFYINRCGFHAVEFFNEHHPDPNMPEQFDQEDGLFKFEKRMKQEQKTQ
jgi:hypothetical protein